MNKKQKANLVTARPAKSNLVKCPAKSSSSLKRLEAEGEAFHKDNSHFCHKCSCKRPAGYGTDHLGYGWCMHHEKNVSEDIAKNFAIKHKETLQQHQPFVYRNPDQWLKEIQKSGMRSQKKVDLYAEIEVARGIVAEIIEKAQKGTFTETYKDGPREASDATRAKSIKGLLDSLGKLSITKMKIDESETFTRDELRVMMSQLGTIAQECIMDETPDRQVVWAKFVRMIKEVKGLNPHG